MTLVAARPRARPAGWSRPWSWLRSAGRADLAVLGFCALSGPATSGLASAPATTTPGRARRASSSGSRSSRSPRSFATCRSAARPRSPAPWCARWRSPPRRCSSRPSSSRARSSTSSGSRWRWCRWCAPPALSWLLVGGAVAVVATAMAGEWQWGHAQFDVFAEVQGSSAALLHGQNPYSQLYSVFLGWVPARAGPTGRASSAPRLCATGRWWCCSASPRAFSGTSGSPSWPSTWPSSRPSSCGRAGAPAATVSPPPSRRCGWRHRSCRSWCSPAGRTRSASPASPGGSCCASGTAAGPRSC